MPNCRDNTIGAIESYAAYKEMFCPRAIIKNLLKWKRNSLRVTKDSEVFNSTAKVFDL